MAGRWFHRGRPTPSTGRRATIRNRSLVVGLALVAALACIIMRSPPHALLSKGVPLGPLQRRIPTNALPIRTGGGGPDEVRGAADKATTVAPLPSDASSATLQWQSNVYLPLSDAAISGFQLYEKKLRKRMGKQRHLDRIWGLRATVVPMLMRHGGSGDVMVDGAYDDLQYDFSFLDATIAGASPKAVRQRLCGDNNNNSVQPRLGAQSTARAWSTDGARHAAFACGCLRVVPECQFFLHVGNASMAFVKCCTEHFKMKTTLTDLIAAMHVASASSAAAGANIDRQLHRPPQFFLDSGTLLSSVRDGGATLLPWETDIDLGVVGSDPLIEQYWHRALEAPLPTTTSEPRRHRHYVERCRTDPATRRCNDAHYVYFARDRAAAKNDTSRVEIWPFHINQQSQVLEHPTRPWLSVAVSMVLPLRPCFIWGVQVYCPRDAHGYLDHEYEGRDGWWRPRTIHWGERNVQSWGHAGTRRQG